MINKKTLFVTAVLILFSIAPHVLAQGFVPLAEIEGLTKGVEANTEGLAVFFNNLYKFAIGMATVLAVIMIIWGGIEYSWQDIPGAKSSGKDRILQAILGLVLVLSPVLVFSIINPAILNLSINLKPLDTKSGATTAKTTTEVPLSKTETETRESSGGKVLYAFSVNDTSSLGQRLDEEQNKCTQAPGGPGIILPVLATGAGVGGGGAGGVINYSCQTCPSNTTPTLFPKGKKDSSPRGFCQPK